MLAERRRLGRGQATGDVDRELIVGRATVEHDRGYYRSAGVCGAGVRPDAATGIGRVGAIRADPPELIMSSRSIVTVILLSLVTLGIYALVWLVKTKREMNQRGADIPTTWLAIVPVVGLWWAWRYGAGVERVTGGRLSQVMAFVVLVVLGVIGMAIIQDGFNKASAGAASAR